MTAGNSNNADLDRRFLALVESGEFGPEELWAISFLLDLFDRTGRTRITTTYERLAAVMDISARTLRNYLSAFEKIAWLVIIRTKKGVVVALNLSVLDESVAVVQEEVQETGGNRRQHAANGGNMRQITASGGDKGGAGGRVGFNDPVWGYLLFGERAHPQTGVNISHPPARPNNGLPDAAKCHEMPPNAVKCREMPPNAANFLGAGSPSEGDEPPGAAKCHEMPPDATKCREMPPNATSFRGELQAAAEQVDEDTLKAVLEAAGDAFLLTEADARRALALAARRDIPGEIVVAAALYTRWKVEREGGLKRPARYFQRLLEKDNPAREVSEQALREARKTLGLHGEEMRDVEEEDVEIVGDPPYNPLHVWRTAKALLGEALERRDYNTWLRDARLLAWKEGEFVVGVPNAFAKDWVSNRLNGHVSRALAQSAGLEEGDISVRYVVAPVRRW